MQTGYRLIVAISLLFSLLRADTTAVNQFQRWIKGWDYYGVVSDPESLLTSRFRVEYIAPTGKLTCVDFFDETNRFVRRHELYYAPDGNLAKQLVYDQNHKLRYYYLYAYDPIMGDWKVTQYAPRGEWLREKYFHELSVTEWILNPYGVTEPQEGAPELIPEEY
jgi:hypothetical protein